MKSPKDLKKILSGLPRSYPGTGGGNGGDKPPIKPIQIPDDDPFSKSGKPEFLQKIDKDIFKSKYVSTTQSNQHVTDQCYAEMLVGAQKFAKANLVDATLDRSVETLGRDPETDRSYQAHHKAKLEALLTENLAPVTGCEKMGYDCAKLMHEEAQRVQNQKQKEKEEKKPDKAEMMKALAENKSTEAGNSSESAASRE